MKEIDYYIDSPSAMEPMFPPRDSVLEDCVVELLQKSSALQSQLHPNVAENIGILVRSMNCYYSNLIEGHDTHPRDIDRALHNDYSGNIEKRNLQQEAVAHIAVQEMIDQEKIPHHIATVETIRWLHREFCVRLPEDLLWVESQNKQKRVRIEPGVLRDGEVIVGQHIPPIASSLERFLERFADSYEITKLHKIQQVIAVAASHHRLLWIHPFYDGNGRVARLFSHAYLKAIGVGNSLWSVARGLARNASTYKSLLMQADMPRQGDLDGRGNLTTKGLRAFCLFFLKTCIDQIEYMSSVLEPQGLLVRMEIYVKEQIRKKALPLGSFHLLREALLSGSFDRGRAGMITGYKERQARTVLASLLDKKLLISNSPRGPVQLGFPIDVIERWFPKFYPVSTSPAE